MNFAEMKRGTTRMVMVPYLLLGLLQAPVKPLFTGITGKEMVPPWQTDRMRESVSLPEFLTVGEHKYNIPE